MKQRVLCPCQTELFARRYVGYSFKRDKKKTDLFSYFPFRAHTEKHCFFD